MDDLLKEAEKLKARVQEDMEKRSVAQGKLEAALDSLKELGFSDEEDARKALIKLENEIKDLHTQGEKKLQELREMIEKAEADAS